MSYVMLNIAVTVLFVGFIIWKILPARGVKQIRIEELHHLMEDEDVQLIDVRPQMKYQQSHIRDFKNIPLKEIKKQAAHLSKDKPVVTVCQTGAQGNEACKRLKRRGFKQLANVQGGISTWEPMRAARK